jgi:hypothetical protein
MRLNDNNRFSPRFSISLNVFNLNFPTTFTAENTKPLHNNTQTQYDTPNKTPKTKEKEGMVSISDIHFCAEYIHVSHSVVQFLRIFSTRFSKLVALTIHTLLIFIPIPRTTVQTDFIVPPLT